MDCCRGGYRCERGEGDPRKQVRLSLSRLMSHHGWGVQSYPCHDVSDLNSTVLDNFWRGIIPELKVLFY